MELLAGATVNAFYFPVKCWNAVLLLSRQWGDVWSQCKCLLQPWMLAALSWSCFALHISSLYFFLAIEHHWSLFKHNASENTQEEASFCPPVVPLHVVRFQRHFLRLPRVEFPQNQRALFWKSSKIIIWILQTHGQPRLHFRLLIWG